MKSRFIIVIGVIGLLLAVVVTVVVKPNRASVDSSETAAEDVATVEKVAGEPERIVSSEKAKAKPRRPRKVVAHGTDVEDDDDASDDELTPAERALQDRIDKAYEDEKLTDLCAISAEVVACTNAEIRQSYVDALGFFGSKALAELTPFLADPDEDVRESAQNEWSMAVSDVENDGEKISIVEMAMAVVSDEDFLEEISGEYIGIDEKLAVESLVHIISNGRSEAGVAKAKETYEFVTGDEWQGADEAARWIAEEYEPPED